MPPRFWKYFFLPVLSFVLPIAAPCQTGVPPYDLWTPQVMSEIRDQSTLEMSISPSLLYSEIFYTSNSNASWFDAKSPYAEHKGDKIRIHAFIASPMFGGPYPALVIGHGHHGKADRDLAIGIASLGYVALSIDGPRAGQSTGGPEDDNQAWISVDKGPQYSYLYHYAYAGMRGLTLLEFLAAAQGNPFRIDPSRLGVLGASMGGMFTTYINGVDDRVKAAVILASAGNLQHTLRYPNSWLYNGIYAGTRDLPYNGSDPLNAIENVDSDTTAITFMNYFDPIRYATRQRAPVLTIIGTHDEYFPLPNANLMQLAISPEGTNPKFLSRLWLLPNAPHQFDTSANLTELAGAVQQWLNYCFTSREKPLATPSVERGGLAFQVALAEPASRLEGVQAIVYVANRIDSTVTPIRDFKSYPALRQGTGFSVQIPAADQPDASKLIYYATVTDSRGLSVSSPVYKASTTAGQDRALDLSSGFVPTIEHFPDNTVAVPLPPPLSDAVVTVTSTMVRPNGSSYEGLALTNPSANPIVVRLEARTTEGRIAATEGLINPVFIPVPALGQRAFLPDEWMGMGTRNLNGTLRLAWSSVGGSALGFRGDVPPAAGEFGGAFPVRLEGNGPASLLPATQWIPLVPEKGSGVSRRLRIYAPSTSAADVQVFFRNRFGADGPLATKSVQGQIAAGGVMDLEIPAPTGNDNLDPAIAEVRASAAVAARLEGLTPRDEWSVEACTAPTGTTVLAPHVEWNGSYQSRLVLVNVKATNQDARIRLRNREGAEVAPASVLLLQPGTSTSMSIESVAGIPPTAPAGSGWLELENPGSGILAWLVIEDSRTGASTSSLLAAGKSGQSILPFTVEDALYWTGLALANRGDAPANLSIAVYAADGRLAGRAGTTLAAKTSQTALVSQWVPELRWNATGYIVISSDGEVAALSYFGTMDGKAVAAIPLQ